MAPITRSTVQPPADRSDSEDEHTTGPKFFNLHLYPRTNRWGAWVKEPRTGGKRIYLGTHSSKYLAARCQDRARLKIWTEEPVPLYFNISDYDEDEPLRNSLSIPDFVELLRSESRGAYKISDSSACLQKFITEELAGGALPEGLLGIEPVSDVAELPEELISEASVLQQLEHVSALELEELKSDPLLMLHFVAEAAASRV